MFGQAVSPYLYGLLVEAGVQDVYASGVDLFATFLRIDVSISRIYRSTLAVGNALTDSDLYSISSVSTAESESVAVSSLPTYAEIDGSMLLTDDGWKEVKVGRTFEAKNVQIVGSVPTQKAPRREITESQYCAHLGNAEAFLAKFSTLLANLCPSVLIFITDGAEWIRLWLLAKYPNAIHILDYFHAVAHLAEAVRGTQYERTWLDTQKELLLEHNVRDVIINIKALRGVDEEKKRLVLQYYEKNADRMNYRYYREQGWCIGSGAIEAAHRTLIQQRMKLSGQRWSEEGAKTLLKLRVAFLSNKKHLIEKIIKNAA